jgi:hypothetical protein
MDEQCLALVVDERTFSSRVAQVIKARLVEGSITQLDILEALRAECRRGRRHDRSRLVAR